MKRVAFDSGNVFISLGYIPRSRNYGEYGYYVSSFEEPSHCFSQWLYHFTFPQGVYEGCNFSTPSIFVTVFFMLVILVDMKWYFL